MIKTVIIDDESSALSTIKQIILLGKLPVNIIGTANSVESGVKLIEENNPELVLLDIELGDGTGFELLEYMTQINFKIIFVTASDTYALKAFKYSALDYIVKPVDPEELADAINRAAQSARIDNLELQMKILIDNLLPENKEPDKLVLKTSEAIHVVKTDQIVRCEADRNYTMFFMDNGEKILISNTLKEYEKILPDRSFIRVHNSHLVNIEKIKKYEKLTSGCLIMSDNSLVPVSVRKKDTLMHLLGKI